MTDPRRLYDLLLDHACGEARVSEVIIGLTWTLCRGEGVGQGQWTQPQGECHYSSNFLYYRALINNQTPELLFLGSSGSTPAHGEPDHARQ